MQTMRFVQVCEIPGMANSTNPNGLGVFGYAEGAQCNAFTGVAARPAPVCKPGHLGPGLRSILCDPQPKTAQQKPAPPPAPTKSPVVVPVAPAAATTSARRLR